MDKGSLRRESTKPCLDTGATKDRGNSKCLTEIFLDYSFLAWSYGHPTHFQRKIPTQPCSPSRITRVQFNVHLATQKCFGNGLFLITPILLSHQCSINLSKLSIALHQEPLALSVLDVISKLQPKWASPAKKHFGSGLIYPVRE